MEIDELAVKITGDSTSLQSAMNQATESMQKLGINTSTLTGLLGAAGLTAIFKKAYDAANEMVEAFRGDEVAALKYAAALQASNKITTEGKAALDAYVPVFASLSGIAEADTQSMIAMLAAYGRTDEQIKTMMQTAQGMANVLGIDVNTALTQLNMTFSGTTGRLAQQTPALKDLTAEQLKNGEGVRLLAAQYAQFSDVLKDSTDVSIKNYKNAYSDMMSAMGSSIAATLKPVRDAMTDAFRWIADDKSGQRAKNTLQIIELGLVAIVAAINPVAGAISGAIILITNLIGQVSATQAAAAAATAEAAAKWAEANKGQADDLDAMRLKALKVTRDRVAAEKKAADDTAKAWADAEKKIIEGRKTASQQYTDTLAQIDTRVKLGIITEQDAADAKYAANKKLIDDLIALGYTGAEETGQIGDKTLKEAIAREKKLADAVGERGTVAEAKKRAQESDSKIWADYYNNLWTSEQTAIVAQNAARDKIMVAEEEAEKARIAAEKQRILDKANAECIALYNGMWATESGAIAAQSKASQEIEAADLAAKEKTIADNKKRLLDAEIAATSSFYLGMWENEQATAAAQKAVADSVALADEAAEKAAIAAEKKRILDAANLETINLYNGMWASEVATRAAQKAVSDAAELADEALAKAAIEQAKARELKIFQDETTKLYLGMAAAEAGSIEGQRKASATIEAADQALADKAIAEAKARELKKFQDETVLLYTGMLAQEKGSIEGQRAAVAAIQAADQALADKAIADAKARELKTFQDETTKLYLGMATAEAGSIAAQSAATQAIEAADLAAKEKAIADNKKRLLDAEIAANAKIYLDLWANESAYYANIKKVAESSAIFIAKIEKDEVDSKKTSLQLKTEAIQAQLKKELLLVGDNENAKKILIANAAKATTAATAEESSKQANEWVSAFSAISNSFGTLMDSQTKSILQGVASVGSGIAGVIANAGSLTSWASLIGSGISLVISLFDHSAEKAKVAAEAAKEAAKSAEIAQSALDKAIGSSSSSYSLEFARKSAQEAKTAYEDYYKTASTRNSKLAAEQTALAEAEKKLHGYQSESAREDTRAFIDGYASRVAAINAAADAAQAEGDKYKAIYNTVYSGNVTAAAASIRKEWYNALKAATDTYGATSYEVKAINEYYSTEVTAANKKAADAIVDYMKKYDDATKTKLQLINKERDAEIVKATALGASAAQLAEIRAYYAREYADEQETEAKAVEDAAKALKPFKYALQDANKTLSDNKSLFKDASKAAEAYNSVLSKVVSSAANFYASLQNVGSDIASKLIDNFKNGLTKADFLTTMKEYLTDLVLQTAIYTDALKTKMAQIGTRIAAGIASGMGAAEITSIRDELSALYESASKSAATARELVSSAFAAPVRALGGVARGSTWVGERGAELIDLPAGSYVHDAQESKRIAAERGNSNNIFNFYSPKALTPAEMKRQFRIAQRQAAFMGAI